MTERKTDRLYTLRAAAQDGMKCAPARCIAAETARSEAALCRCFRTGIEQKIL